MEVTDSLKIFPILPRNNDFLELVADSRLGLEPLLDRTVGERGGNSSSVMSVLLKDGVNGVVEPDVWLFDRKLNMELRLEERARSGCCLVEFIVL